MTAFFAPRRIRAGFVIFLLLLGTIVLVPPATGLAQDGTLEWSRPIPLSGALGGSRYPFLVADDNGQILLGWGVTGAQDAAIFVSRFDGQVWQRPVDVLLGGPRTRAQMDGRNHIHMLYPRGPNQTLGEAEFQTADSVRGWTGSRALNSTGESTAGDFLFADNDELHTLWMQQLESCPNCFTVGYKKYGTDISPELSYRVLVDNTTSPEQRVQLRRGADGTLYAMWDIAARSGVQDGIALSISEDDGATWSNEIRQFATTDAPLRQPLLFIDNTDKLVLVYNYGVRDETYYSISSDRGITWSAPAPVPGLYANKLADASDYFAAITDSAGITHLIASGRTATSQLSPGLYHLTWDGTSWGDPQELYNEGRVPEFPTVALSNGNRLHVSFSTRDPSPVDGNVLASYQVWYTNAQTSAPAATRVPLPTFTPTPTPTFTPEPTGTPTPRPSATPLPLNAGTATDPSGATNSILPLLIVVVPVLLILLGVIVWVNLRRRR